MRKKFLSAFLLGALTLAGTSTFTSCKDYDGDIASLKNDVAANADALKKAQADLEQKINNLKADLSAKDAELQALINQANAAIDAEVLRAMAAESALETRITTAEGALNDLRALIDTKVDQSEFDTTVRSIYAKLEAVETGLGNALTQIATLQAGLDDEKTAREAADTNLQMQIDALNAYKARVEALENKQTEILGSIDELKKALSDEEGKLISVLELSETMNDLSKKVDALSADVNILTVLVKNALRSIVFRPDLYYWGVEGTKLLTLDCKTWELEKTAYNHVESVFLPTHPYYKSENTFRVLDFTAMYHMNPSSADKTTFKDVQVLSDDKDFYTDGEHTSRAAACGLYVADWTTEAGMLKVNLGVTDKNKIKKVVNDSQITVFATQVTVADGEKGDTTITSDYATLIKDEAKNLYLWHKTGEDVPNYDIHNSHCCECAVGAQHEGHGLGHLLATPYEAGIDFLPQDSCNWNETLDLRKLVGTHYVDEKGTEKDFDVEKYGMKYVFELTGLYLEENETSESAHAAINPADGYTFRPQMPNYDKDLVGTQQPYGYKQDRQTIGRTPLVRVSLVDNKDGKVYAYGYIRIKITEPTVKPEDMANKYIAYTGKNYTYNQECTLPAWSYQTVWIQTEYDLYNMLGLTREEFEAFYKPELDGDAFVQYTKKADGVKKEIVNPETDLNVVYYDGGSFAKAEKNYGIVKTVIDASIDEDGTRSSILKWNMTGAQAYQYFVTEKNKSLTVAVRYISKNVKYPDVYVVMSTGAATVNYPSAVAEWDAAKINNYWYATDANQAKTGLDEIHANTITPEDAEKNGKDISEFTDMFSDVFYGNFTSTPSTLAEILKITDYTAGKEFAANKLTVDFIFHKSNIGKEFTVKDIVNGKEVATRTYVMSVDEAGKQLSATLKGTSNSQIVAMIDGNAGDYKAQKVVLNPSQYTKDLLNYKSHNDLKDAIFAVIGLKAVNECNKPLAIDTKTFNVRFLRPLNMRSSDKEIEDANIQKVQEIKMVDLVEFNDWRDAWDNEDDTWGPYNYDKLMGNPIKYSKYYGIKSITVDGVAPGHNIAECPYAITNLGQANENTWVTLASVSDQLEFIYEEPMTRLSSHKLVYTNLSSTLSKCVVKVPVTVEYYWGKLRGTASITIYGSHHNAD